MKILFLGDVFGRPGREAVQKWLPKVVKKHKPDFVIANAENIAHGNGITENTLNEIDSAGIIDAYTSGDHIYDQQKDVKKIFKDSSFPLLRPHNYDIGVGGLGYKVVSKGAKRILVINLLGEVFIKQEVSNPFIAADEILSKFTLKPQEEGKEHVNAIFLDFHAEATSEKRAMGFYLDGRISAITGTHTHVPTLDAQILQNKTAYITDTGMCGPYNSMIGLVPNYDVYLGKAEKFKKEVGDSNKAEIGSILVEVAKTGEAKSIKHLREIVKYV